jgi:predicted phosphoribosyltransferase
MDEAVCIEMPLILGGNRFSYGDFHQISDDEVTSFLGRALSPVEGDQARWKT